MQATMVLSAGNERLLITEDDMRTAERRGDMPKRDLLQLEHQVLYHWRPALP